MDYNTSKCTYILGIITAFINGLTHPVGSLIFSFIYFRDSEMYVIGQYFGWQGVDTILDDKYNEIMKYILGYIGFSFYVFIPNFVQFLLMTKIEDEITNNIR